MSLSMVEIVVPRSKISIRTFLLNVVTQNERSERL